MPLLYLNGWAPFRIDALGLMKFVGTEAVNKKVGGLVQSRYTKSLSLLGAYLIAGYQFMTVLSEFMFFLWDCLVFSVKSALSFLLSLARGQQPRDLVATIQKLEFIFLSRESRPPLLYQTSGCGSISCWIAQQRRRIPS